MLSTISYKQQMTEQKSEFRKLLEKQSHTILKEHLSHICFDFTKVKVNGTKEAMMRRIYFEIESDLQKLKQDGKTAEDLEKFLINFWTKYKFPLSPYKASTLKRTAQSYFDTSLRQYSKSSNIGNHSGNRLQRQTPIQIAPNVWNSSKKCICQQPSRVQNTSSLQQPCYQCGNMCHLDCLWSKQNDELLECPFCYMRYCNPAKEVQHIFFASYLFKKNRQRCQTKIYFNVSPEIKKDKGLIFQLRSVRLGCKISRFQTTFPDSCFISLNGKRIADFRPLPKNTPLKRRADEEVKIEKAQIIAGQNELIIDQRGTSMNKEQNPVKIGKFDHMIMVVAVLPKTCTDILQRVKLNLADRTISKDSMKIYKNSTTSQDIQMQKIKVPLFCQFYGQRILFPGRSRHCTHPLTFDVRNFVMAMMMNTKSSSLRWKCPLCKKRAYDLVIDNYLLNIIQQNKFRKIKEVVINMNFLEQQPLIIQQENSEPDSQQERQAQYTNEQNNEQNNDLNNEQNNDSIQQIGQDQWMQTYSRHWAGIMDVNIVSTFKHSNEKLFLTKQNYQSMINEVKRPAQKPSSVIQSQESQHQVKKLRINEIIEISQSESEKEKEIQVPKMKEVNLNEGRLLMNEMKKIMQTKWSHKGFQVVNFNIIEE